jgi:hypothetical protein
MGHINGDDDGVGYGVRGHGTINTTGVRGLTGNAVFDPNVDPPNVGVFGKGGSNESGDDGALGVFGKSEFRAGVYGKSIRSMGVYGESDSSFGVYGSSDTAAGVNGRGVFGDGVAGQSNSGNGVAGESIGGFGVYGSSDTGVGVQGTSDKNAGVHGISNGGGAAGVRAWGFGSAGVASLSDDTAGVWLGNFSAGEFWGDVNIYGNLTSGTKSFKIDHPLDPSNKYLYHSSVESPDMKNVYDGVVVLDTKGEAVVVLSAWFDALNKEFRYQLTPIGAPGPNLHIAKEIENQRFKIAGGSSGMKVCWQVTGIRQDPLAQANPLVVEQDKLANERDHYLHPAAHGYPAQKSMVEVRHPEELGQFRKEQQKIT